MENNNIKIYKKLNIITFIIYWIIEILTVIAIVQEGEGNLLFLIVSQLVVYLPFTISICFKKAVPGTLILICYNILNTLYGGIRIIAGVIAESFNIINILTNVSLFFNSIFMLNLSISALRKTNKPAKILIFILTPMYVLLNIISFCTYEQKLELLDWLGLFTTIILSISISLFYGMIENEEVKIFKELDIKNNKKI